MFSLLCNWIPESVERAIFDESPVQKDLAVVEKRILEKYIKSKGVSYRAFFVDISNSLVFNEDENEVNCISTVESSPIRIRTVIFNEDKPGTPLVLVHGFAVALGFWAANIPELAKDRPVYTFDLLGLGRSTRPPTISPSIWVESIEEWRNEVLPGRKFILAGLSLAGYIIALYAKKYPSFLHHLVLIDPWGLAEKRKEERLVEFLGITNPLLINVTRVAVNYMNPWAFVRALGPFALWIAPRSHFATNLPKYRELLGDEGVRDMTEYMCLANSIRNPIAEIAIRNLQLEIKWTKPPNPKLSEITEDIPITYMKGIKAWVAHPSDEEILGQRKNIYLHRFENGSHELYLDSYEEFHEVMDKIIEEVERKPEIIKS